MLQMGIDKIIKSKSRAFLTFCFFFILGVSVFSWITNESNLKFYLFYILFFDLLLLIFFWSNFKKRFFTICCLFFILGGLRFCLSIPNFQENNLIYYNGRNVQMVGKVSNEIVIKENNNQVVVTVSSVYGKKVTGKVLLYLPSYTDLKYGDLLKIACQLKKPIGSESFVNYDKYLAKDGIWSQCNWPKIEKIFYQTNWFDKIVSNFFVFKQSFQARVDSLWVEPESSLMAGLLYGARSGFSAQVNNDFSRAGITHIVAISGYNISVVSKILMSLLLLIGLNRRRAFWFAIFGIILFVIFTGASASVVRAGVMGVIVLLASQMGRLSRVGNVLVFTAAVMLLFNPFVLVWDAGFQLSFLSTMGLVYLAPILIQYLSVDDKKIILKSLTENFITTLSAIIFTLPLILFQFGRLSLVAPVANLLIVWIVPYLMLAGFIAIVLSVIFFPLGWLMAWIAFLGLKYVIIMAHTFSSWPLASVNFSISFLSMIVLYSLIAYFIYKYAKD